MDKKHAQHNLTFYITLITYTVGLVMAIIYWEQVSGLIEAIIKTLAPFIVGIAIAYILNLPMRFLETKAFPFLLRGKTINPKLMRGISLFLSVVFVLALITAIFAISDG